MVVAAWRHVVALDLGFDEGLHRLVLLDGRHALFREPRRHHAVAVADQHVAGAHECAAALDLCVLPGLYGAGSSGQGGLLLEGHGHHLGWAFTSGRIAGRNAAYEVVTEDTVEG